MLQLCQTTNTHTHTHIYDTIQDNAIQFGSYMHAIMRVLAICPAKVFNFWSAMEHYEGLW